MRETIRNWNGRSDSIRSEPALKRRDPPSGCFELILQSLRQLGHGRRIGNGGNTLPRRPEIDPFPRVGVEIELAHRGLGAAGASVGGAGQTLGEGKLAGKTAAPVISQEDQLLRLPDAARLDGARELRRALDEVVAALDRIGALREQLSHRQEEIREFLARHAEQNEREWARDFAGEVFNLMRRSPSSYAAVTQTVVAQANISRSTVVSLLS